MILNQKLTDKTAVTTSNDNDLQHIVQGNISYKITKANYFKALQQQIDALSSGFIGSLAIADTPTTDGTYIASESGTYTNAGGLVVNLVDNLTYIAVEDTQTTFSKIEIPVSTLGYNVVTDLTTFDALISGATSGDWLIINDVILDANKVLPANVKLIFRGGIISGAFTLTGDETEIDSNIGQIFSTDVLFTGDWKVDTYFPEWFGANLTDDSSLPLSKALVFANGKEVKISNDIRIDTIGSYPIIQSINVTGKGTLNGNNSVTSGIIIGGTFDYFKMRGVTIKNVDNDIVTTSADTYVINRVEILNTTCFDSFNAFDFDCMVKSALIDGNYIHDLTNAGQVAGFQIGNNNWESEPNQSNYIVKNNRLLDFENTVSGNCMGVLLYGYNMTISGNIVENILNSFDGSDSEGIYTKAVNSTVYGNALTNAGTGQGSINLKGGGTVSGQTVCYGNVLRSTSGLYNGIHVETDNVKVFDNIIEGFGQFAIDTSSSTFAGIEVYNNTILNHRGIRGIYINSPSNYIKVTGNTITELLGTQGTPTDIEGIYIRPSAGSIDFLNVSRNTITTTITAVTTNLSGIKIQPPSGHTISDCFVKDNIFAMADSSVTVANIMNVWISANGDITRLKGGGYGDSTSTQPLRFTSANNVLEFYFDWVNLGVVTMENASSPSVRYGKVFRTAGTTTITQFDNGTEGQEFTVVSAHAITINDNANIQLSGSANFTMAVGDVITFVRSGSVWHEKTRTVI